MHPYEQRSSAPTGVLSCCDGGNDSTIRLAFVNSTLSNTHYVDAASCATTLVK